MKDAKSIVESLEKEIFKLRVEIKKSESTVQKLQEATSLNAQNQNNTSSNFTLPSEFKKNWEILVQESILDVFTIFFDRHFELFHLVRCLFQVVYKRIEDSINDKLKEICRIFALPEQSADGLRKGFLKLLQDQCKVLFPCPEIESIKRDYYDKVKEFLEDDSSKDYEEMAEMSEFEEFVKSVHGLCVYMLLSEPPLIVPFTEYLDYKVFKTEDFYCIDGFPKNSLPCVVILPPAMRNNFAYQGLKPAILILSRDVNHMSHEEQLMKTGRIKSQILSRASLLSSPGSALDISMFSPQKGTQTSPHIDTPLSSEKITPISPQKATQTLPEFEPRLSPIKPAENTDRLSDASIEEIKNPFRQSPIKKVRSDSIIPSPSKPFKAEEHVLQNISRNMLTQNSASSLVEITPLKLDLLESRQSDKRQQESPSRVNTPKEISPRIVIDRYSKLKYKLKNLQSAKPASHNASYLDEEDRYSMPLQRKSPFPVTDKKSSYSSSFSHEPAKRHSLSYTKQIENEDIPISAATQAALQRKRAENSCPVCKPKVPCDKCYNSKLLAMARKLPISALYTSKYKPTKVPRSSLFESPGRTESTKVMTSALSQKLSEVSKKALRNSNPKTKSVERDTCRVM